MLAKWKLLLVLTIVGALTGFAASRLQPRMYQSRATIYAKQSQGAGSILSSLPVALPGSASSSGYYATLLQSETMFRTLIARLGLIGNLQFTGGRKMTVEKAVGKLKKTVDVRDNARIGCVDILVRSTDPRLAARIGNTMLDCLDGMVVTASRRKVGFISGRLRETSSELREAEDELRRFMEANNVAAVEEQTRSLVQELSVLDGRLLTLDVEREQLGSRLANSGELESLMDDEVQKRAIESGREFVLKKRADLEAKLAELPKLATEYARLQRRISVLGRTFELLTEQYQLERITRQGEDGDYQIIDRARPNTTKVSPSTLVNTIVGAILGFTLTALAVSAFPPPRRHKKGQ